MLEIIDGAEKSAEENMAFDKKLLEEVASPVLHFYRWKKKSITHGIFIKPENILNINKLEEYSVEVAKRPTGGGVVFHMWDFAFSFLLPKSHQFFFLNPLKNYHFVNGMVMEALKKGLNMRELYFNGEKRRGDFCMANPTKYDILFKGKKIAGAAQRMGEKGYLHQGTISLMMPKKEELQLFLKDQKMVDSIIFYTYPLLQTRDKLKRLLFLEFKKRFV